MNNDESRLFSVPDASDLSSEHTHEIRRVEVAHDPTLSYSLPVPRTMYSATAGHPHAPSPYQATAVGLFGLDNALDEPYITVCAQTLPWEVDPGEWIRYGWIRAGWRIVVCRVLPGRGGPRYELGAIKEADGRHQVRRTIATRSGSTLLRADAIAQVRDWAQWHDRLWVALDGLTPVRPRAATVESLIARAGPLIRFATPATWDARGESTANNGAAWAAQPTQGVQRGALLRVRAHESALAPPADKRRAIAMQVAQASGVTFTEVLRPQDRPAFREYLPGWQGQWAVCGTLADHPVELRIAQREQAAIAVDYALLCPAAGSDHIDWMRATRAFDIAQSTTDFRPLPQPAAVPAAEVLG